MRFSLPLLLAASLADAFQAPAGRARRCAPRPALAESSLVLADAEAALGGVVKFLPFLGIPAVVVGIPFVVYKRLSALEGDDYTDSVFTDKDPYQGVKVERGGPSQRELQELSYEELVERFGDPTLNDSESRQAAAARQAAARAPEPAAPAPGFELPALELPKFELFGKPAAPAPEPAADEPAEEAFKFPWQ